MAEQQSDELVQKNVAFYQTFLSAWVSSRMEKDKQILTLSALAIGLLMTFHDKLDDVFAFVIWLVAGAVYVLSIAIVLIIFGKNSDYIEKIIRDDDNERVILEKTLHRMTFWAFVLFLLGVVLTIVLAVYGSGFIVMKGP